jgi:hypothetical protein
MKKKWIKPSLIIIMRNKTGEESVLASCKSGGVMQSGPSNEYFGSCLVQGSFAICPNCSSSSSS